MTTEQIENTCWAGCKFLFLILVLMVTLLIGIQIGRWVQRHQPTTAPVAQVSPAVARIQERAALYGRTVDPTLAEYLSNRPLLAAICEAEVEFCSEVKTGPAGEEGMFRVIPKYWGVVPKDPSAQARQAEKILQSLAHETGNTWSGVERYNGTGADARAYKKKVRRIYLALLEVQP
jgi:hypothetical protein